MSVTETERIVRLNNSGILRDAKSFQEDRFGLYKRSESPDEIRESVRTRVKKFITQIDEDMKNLNDENKKRYLNNLDYYIPALMVGIMETSGENLGRQRSLPKKFYDLMFSTKNDIDFANFFDHFSKSSNNNILDEDTGEKIYEYTSHPYDDFSADQLEDYSKALKTIGWTFNIEANSGHFPTKTLKITFHKIEKP